MLRTLNFFALAALLFCPASGVSAETPHTVLVLGPAGVANPQPNVLSVAAPLANVSKHEVTRVKVTRVELGRAPLQTSLPILVGVIPAGGNVVVQAQFDSGRLMSGKTYEFELHGTYRSRDRDDDDEHGDHKRRGRDDDDDEHKFKVHTLVIVPPPPEGSGVLGTVQVPPQKVTGGNYPPQPPQQDPDVNSGGPTVPTNPEVLGAPTPSGTQVAPPQ